jgi:hypothetical protein
MNDKVIKTLTDYLNNMVEADTRERWPENNKTTKEEIFVRRMVIIDNPKEGIYKAVRRFGERQLGVHDSLYDVFPAGLIKITLRFIGKRMDDNKCTLKDLVPDLSIAEENTPAAFPRMLALLASEWLSNNDRWKTRRFKKLIAYIERTHKQKQD